MLLFMTWFNVPLNQFWPKSSTLMLNLFSSLEAINSDSPDLRYVVGHDALRLLDSRMNMSESEFKRFMMGNFFGKSIPK
jgi:hypothetical protein